MAFRQSPYDDVPYPSHPQPQVHPDRMAFTGRLFGLDSADVARCRVLEIGCGDGAHLVPLAAAFPESQFVGIDTAAAAVDRARNYARDCGLTNVEFRYSGVGDSIVDSGCYDYILCHGVFSWVPSSVREVLLDVCRRSLAPAGLAFVSYNALPGWSLHQPTRDVLLWHIRDIVDPAERLEEARAFATFLSGAICHRQPDGLALRSEFKWAVDKEPQVLWHDELGPDHQAFYFHEFMAMASRHQLAFVGDADLGEHLLKTMPEPVAAALSAASGDRLEREQYIDFLVPRRFRQTILTHAARPMLPEADAERLSTGWFSRGWSSLECSGPILEPGVGRFKLADGATLELDFLPGKIVLHLLTESAPSRLPFTELFEQTAQRLTSSGHAHLLVPGLRSQLLRFLFDIASARLVNWHTVPPPFTLRPGDRPRAFVPARVRAATGDLLPNAHHRETRIAERWTRELLMRCDGLRTREEILSELREAVRQSGDERAAAWCQIESDFDGALRGLASMALFVG